MEIKEEGEIGTLHRNTTRRRSLAKTQTDLRVSSVILPGDKAAVCLTLFESDGERGNMWGDMLGQIREKAELSEPAGTSGRSTQSKLVGRMWMEIR